MARPEKQVLEERKKFLTTLAECADKPSKFSDIFLNHQLYPYNAKYVDSKERFIIYRSGRQAGKTMSTAVKSIHFAFFAPLMSDTVKNECTILIAAPTQNQASIMFDRIRSLVQNNDFLKGYIVRNTQTELWLRWLDDGGVTKIITRATGETGATLRGYSPHVIIADECAFIKRSILTAFLPSGMATQAKVWLTSTPYGKNTFFYEAHQNSKPMNPKGLWTEFHVSSLENPTIKADPLFLQQIKNLAQEEYVQEVEGEFLDIGDALFPRALLMEAISDKQPIGRVRYYLGCDIARSGKDETVYCLIAVDEEDTMYVISTEAEAQSNLVNVAGRLGEYCRQYPGIETIYLDETGLGAGVMDMARARDLPVRGIVFTMPEKAEMYTDLRVHFENHRVKIRDTGRLIFQLGYLRREYTDESRKLKIVSDSHDDYADALALACKAMARGDTWHVIPMSDKMNKLMFG